MDAALSSAVSALQAQQNALSTVSNNLANSQTTGYKAVSTQFVSLVTQQSSNATMTGGVAAVARQDLLSNGTITGTSTTTDLAIDGKGMFAVSKGTTTTATAANTYYTRNGAFDIDADGNLYLTGTNYYLEGWETNAQGDVTDAQTLTTVNVNRSNTSATATTKYSMSAILPAEAQSQLAQISYQNTTGGTENVTMSYAQVGTTAATATSDATTTYLVSVNAPSGETIGDGTTTGAKQIVYQVTVDTSAGTSNGMISDIQTASVDGVAQTMTAVTAPATGSLTSSVDFPDITPSDGSAAVTWPTAWTAGATNTKAPTWGQLTTTMATNFTASTSINTYDSKGNPQAFSASWTASGDGTWIMTVSSPTSGGTTDGELIDTAGNKVSSYSYEVSFNTDGSLNTFTGLPTAAGGSAPLSTTGQPEILANYDNGTTASTGADAIVLDFGTSGTTTGLSEFNTGETTPEITVKSKSQNGVQTGSLTGIAVDSSGSVIATYSNGNKVPIYKIPVVTFANENGLSAKTDGVYAATTQSGDPVWQSSGQGGAGTVEGSALEASTVNTSREFSNMITAQQAYSAASKVISTDTTMFNALLQSVQ